VSCTTRIHEKGNPTNLTVVGNVFGDVAFLVAAKAYQDAIFLRSRPWRIFSTWRALLMTPAIRIKAVIRSRLSDAQDGAGCRIDLDDCRLK
jgi:hypothetical protein